MLSLARNDEEHVERDVKITFTLDEVTDVQEFVEVFLSYEVVVEGFVIFSFPYASSSMIVVAKALLSTPPAPRAR